MNYSTPNIDRVLTTNYTMLGKAVRDDLRALAEKVDAMKGPRELKRIMGCKLCSPMWHGDVSCKDDEECVGCKVGAGVLTWEQMSKTPGTYKTFQMWTGTYGKGHFYSDGDLVLFCGMTPAIARVYGPTPAAPEVWSGYFFSPELDATMCEKVHALVKGYKAERDNHKPVLTPHPQGHDRVHGVCDQAVAAWPEWKRGVLREAPKQVEKKEPEDPCKLAHDWKYTPDPSGNNDSSLQCERCGKEATNKQRQEYFKREQVFLEKDKSARCDVAHKRADELIPHQDTVQRVYEHQQIVAVILETDKRVRDEIAAALKPLIEEMRSSDWHGNRYAYRIEKAVNGGEDVA